MKDSQHRDRRGLIHDLGRRPGRRPRGGRTAVTVALVLLVTGAVAGCSGSGPVGTIGPVAPATETTAATEQTAAPTTDPAGTDTEPAGDTEPAATDPPTKEPATDKPEKTLGDDGYGGLYLGMSATAAKATGLVGAKQEGSSSACAIHKGRGDLAFVYLVKGKVSIIAVDPKVRMAKGVGVGDTYRQLHLEYPKATDGGPGRISVPAPGAKVPAHYRIGLNSGDTVFPTDKIIDIALQADDQQCYE